MAAELTKLYEPKSFSDLLGQQEAIRKISSFLSRKVHGALFFEGPSGVGKTSAAWLMAKELGLKKTFVDSFSSIHSSFEDVHVLEGGSVGIGEAREFYELSHTSPRNGWHLFIINQSDKLSTKELASWINWLERKNEHSIFVFTSVTPTKAGSKKGQVDELQSRGVLVNFTGDRVALRPHAESLIRRVWAEQCGVGPVPTIEEIEDGRKLSTLSFRFILKQLQAMLGGYAPGKCEDDSRPADQPVKVYQGEWQAYLSFEAAKHLVGNPKLTQTQAFAIITSRLNEICPMHVDLRGYDPRALVVSGWQASVRKGGKHPSASGIVFT